MERVEEFTRDGKSFMYIDLSNVMSNQEFLDLTELIKPLIAKYPEKSLHTITSIENVIINPESKAIVADFLKHNKPYVKYGTLIGMDGLKKIAFNTIFKLSGRSNMCSVSTKEQAIEWLLKQE